MDDVCGWIEEERDDAQSECSGEENWRERVVTPPGVGVLPPLGLEPGADCWVRSALAHWLLLFYLGGKGRLMKKHTTNWAFRSAARYALRAGHIPNH